MGGVPTKNEDAKPEENPKDNSRRQKRKQIKDSQSDLQNAEVAQTSKAADDSKTTKNIHTAKVEKSAKETKTDTGAKAIEVKNTDETAKASENTKSGKAINEKKSSRASKEAEPIDELELIKAEEVEKDYEASKESKESKKIQAKIVGKNSKTGYDTTIADFPKDVKENSKVSAEAKFENKKSKPVITSGSNIDDNSNEPIILLMSDVENMEEDGDVMMEQPGVEMLEELEDEEEEELDDDEDEKTINDEEEDEEEERRKWNGVWDDEGEKEEVVIGMEEKGQEWNRKRDEEEYKEEEEEDEKIETKSNIKTEKIYKEAAVGNELKTIDLKNSSDSDKDDFFKEEDKEDDLTNQKKEIEDNTTQLKKNLLKIWIDEAMKFHDLERLRKHLKEYEEYKQEAQPKDDPDHTTGDLLTQRTDKTSFKSQKKNEDEIYEKGCDIQKKVEKCLEEFEKMTKEKEKEDFISKWKHKKNNKRWRYLEHQQIIKDFIKKKPKREMPVLTLDRKTIAEIYSYNKPTPIVHRVLQAAFLLLHHREITTKEWKNCQKFCKHYGHSQRDKQWMNFNMDDLAAYQVARAKQLLRDYEQNGDTVPIKYEEIKNASPGAATYYLWAMEIIDRYVLGYNERELEAETYAPINEQAPYSSKMESDERSEQSNFEKVEKQLAEDVKKSRPRGSDSIVARKIDEIVKKVELERKKKLEAEKEEALLKAKEERMSRRRKKETEEPVKRKPVKPETSPTRKPVYYQTSYYDYLNPSSRPI